MLKKTPDGHFAIPQWRLDELERDARQEAALMRAAEVGPEELNEETGFTNDIIEANAG